MDISRRKRQILAQIVALYTGTGDPVGSRILSDFLEGVSVSTATLRNEMAELTRMGLLAQPHTSAGRVPTTEGYRYYVENLMSVRALAKEEREYIKSAVEAMDSDPDRAADEAARFLADMTGLAAITTTPRGGNVQISHFQTFKTGKYNIAILGVTSAGGVKTRVCRLREELSDEKLKELAAQLNSRLCFVSAEDMSEERTDEVREALGVEKAAFAPVASAVSAIIKSAADVRVYTEGREKLLAFPELESKLKELMELFSDAEAISAYLDPGEPLKVFVGDERGAAGFESLGVIVGRYRAQGGRHGALAVAGPVRMNYSWLIPRISCFRDEISAMLTNPA
ncbi:MAG: heat-inducible transcriptional repressor HrcA [Oscillospiraceae bacterium]|nr:heat-inducible transcriptional repressor HrcA [Oscillospiraceae bacterium]